MLRLRTGGDVTYQLFRTTRVAALPQAPKKSRTYFETFYVIIAYMKTTLSLTLSEQDKKRLQPNVSSKLNSIILNYPDTDTLTNILAKTRTSCLLDAQTYKKLQDMEKTYNQPIPRIVQAILAQWREQNGV